MTTRRARRCLVLGPAVALVAMLGACAEFGQSMQKAADDVSAAFQPKEEAPPQQVPTSYCYRTLGKVNCYSQPLPGSEANRLIGYQGPPPRSTSGTGPLSP